MSKVLDIGKLISEGFIPEELRNDAVIKAICKQTRMSADARKAFITVYSALILEVRQCRVQ